ncbi:unnamed protein product [Phaedon cochleariae]|uniref:isopentenyl-diphosphate Delta-isomerase n=1 Tax=Phaedon cochleariae TaxID=80249 RepID=A0A9P0DPR6_PHACE|nr:unnamed protein product [Phaedon cochleariae]
MLTLTIRNAIKRTVGRGFASSLAKSKEHLDPQQEALLSEKCFLVNEKDNIIGQASKRECHLVQKDGNIPLHRAFSVFLFNKKGDLLLQKRSAEKITYPDHYTNSCCSHPIADVPGEEEENGAIGIKRAAQRRLNLELGIPVEQIPIEKLDYITRIHYKDNGNGKWGEHEIDYVLFLQAEVKVKPNPNEISEISFVPRNELDDYLPQLNGPFTPWFQLILKHRLRYWWDNLNNIDEIKDHQNILELKF